MNLKNSMSMGIMFLIFISFFIPPLLNVYVEREFGTYQRIITDADAHVSNREDLINGSLGDRWSCYVGNPVFQNVCEAYFHFNFSHVPENVKIRSIQVRFFIEVYKMITLRMHLTSDKWNEKNITFINRPPRLTLVKEWLMMPIPNPKSGRATWYEINISSFSRRIMRNNGISFLIRVPFEVNKEQFQNNIFCDIYSKDWIEKEERPHLIVHYVHENDFSDLSSLLIIISSVLTGLFLSLFLLRARTIGGKKEKNER